MVATDSKAAVAFEEFIFYVPKDIATIGLPLCRTLVHPYHYSAFCSAVNESLPNSPTNLLVTSRKTIKTKQYFTKIKHSDVYKVQVEPCLPQKGLI